MQAHAAGAENRGEDGGGHAGNVRVDVHAVGGQSRQVHQVLLVLIRLRAGHREAGVEARPVQPHDGEGVRGLAWGLKGTCCPN